MFAFISLFRIEQELLARVVSQMAPVLPDPTTRMRRSSSYQSVAESTDTEPDLAGKLHSLQSSLKTS